ncbi:hypothetical protein BDW42DRAFT_192394 [Aspergillus taichungensis]|uniref:DUF3752 domain-containing protein n=1 Tax=Aspergillus taichungensis TaxID=482145 RepID=A0A2J5I0J3_9EURO|nr:hypothetical protein BDW42DRAFT_192394 [Aspergillus taichungensis]
MAPTSEKRKLDDPNDQQPTADTNTTDKRPRVIGPSLPPPQASNDDSNSDSDSSDDDDDFGPTLPPLEGSVDTSAAAQVATATALANAEKEAREQAAAKPQRDEWMLLPPESSDWGSRVDPTKLRNRKFQSGKGAGSGGGGKGGVDVSWTETPEEKLKRLQDSILGVAAPGEGRGVEGGGSGSGEQGGRSSEVMRERVERYNEAKRKDIAAENEKERKAREEKKKEEDDDPSSRAFDREKDMALSSRITASQRREMINKAGDFGSRFTKGRFL